MDNSGRTLILYARLSSKQLTCGNHGNVGLISNQKSIILHVLYDLRCFSSFKSKQSLV